jgi:hypothetical protein
MQKIDPHVENIHPKEVKQYLMDMIQHINFESNNKINFINNKIQHFY